ncbi:MAG: dihydroorotase family protein [Cyclobacteriaceae bacterium]
MSLLIRSAKIIDPSSSHHGKVRDILIQDGKLKEIASSITASAKKEIPAKGCLLSIGWMDLKAFVGEPGLEYQETIASATAAAAAGGFTQLACTANTEPVVQTKDAVNALKQGNTTRVTDLFPIPSLSKGLKGKELTEIIDLHSVGSTLFSDGSQAVSNADILKKALEYSQVVDATVIDFPQEQSLTGLGQVHESTQSTQQGLVGIPSYTETLQIQRDLEILKYTGGKLHFSSISSKESVNLIKKAKKEGLSVSCDVAVANLAFTEDLVSHFNTNAKVNPPLRSKKDQKALWQGIYDGTIDCIVSDHTPLDEESKKLEFNLASFGMITLQTFLAMIVHGKTEKQWEAIIASLTINPRRISQLAVTSIAEGEKAELTLFNPTLTWEYTEKDNLSLSKNSPLLGQELTGKVIACINGKNQYIA